MEQKKNKNVLDGINPFSRPSEGLPVPYHTEDAADDMYIIERAMVDKVVKTGEGENDFIVVQELKEISRVNRADYINSHREDVGILNVVKKVQLTGDATLLNQRQVIIGDADITNMPHDKVEAMDAVLKGVEDFNALPDEIKGKMSLKQFAEQNSEDYDKLISDLAKKLQKTQDSLKNEGEN